MAFAPTRDKGLVWIGGFGVGRQGVEHERVAVFVWNLFFKDF